MKMNELKNIWTENYSVVPKQLVNMNEVKGVISAFNSNIDAVLKLSGKRIKELINKFGLDESSLLLNGENSIKSIEDCFRGLLKCFKSGIAEEWLIEDENVFNFLKDNIGYDKLQMGGQGGIVANIMAVSGVKNVYVHTASSPKLQSELFHNLPNLLNVDSEGEIKKAYEIDRKDDLPLIHWIIEFDIDDELEIAGEKFICPKSNRFIATYDPLNFKLSIDKNFSDKMTDESVVFDYIILSGYQMLKEKIDEKTFGLDRIKESIKIVEKWRSKKSCKLLHFEIASTQDKVIRKNLIDLLVPTADSIGFNERELIDILEVIGEEELAEKCNNETNSVNLFEGMLKLFNYTKVPRMQLHMFGLYVTIQRKGFKISPVANRNGMTLAAVIAATKAGTGSVDSNDILLWAKDQQVSEIGLNELKALSDYVSDNIGENNLIETGIFENDEMEIIAVPTIIIDKPVTLVGMGDTISSVSLVGAR